MLGFEPQDWDMNFQGSGWKEEEEKESEENLPHV